MVALLVALTAVAPQGASAQSAPAPLGTTVEPLYPVDFPDPSLLRVGSTTYAYATNGPGGNVQVIRSSDLRTWQRLPDALPELPAWAAPDFTWAPSVLAPGGDRCERSTTLARLWSVELDEVVRIGDAAPDVGCARPTPAHPGAVDRSEVLGRQDPDDHHRLTIHLDRPPDERGVSTESG